MDNYQQFIAISRYARWMEKEGRRETWDETVRRYISFFSDMAPEAAQVLKKEVMPAILNHEVMPSMRALMTAGPALERDHAAGYNCSAKAITDPKDFDQVLYLLMCGTGVGFSCERQFINRLPEIPDQMEETDETITPKDSKVGWARALRRLVSRLYAGEVPKWDTSQIRGRGERLKTFGGRASGPEPMEDLYTFFVETFKKAHGRKLTSIEVHDLVCKIGEIVIVGGVRRSALISLSNLTDERMRHAKSGDWWMVEPQRALANNSVAYTEKPDMGAFMREWLSLFESKSGERGMINRVAAKAKVAENGRRDPDHEWLVNPCSEILLRDSGGLCNLSEIVVRPKDTLDDLKRKAILATIIGTVQSTLTDFRYLSRQWKVNAEEERLLGVSITGIMDHRILSGHPYLADWLKELREVVIETNKRWSKRLGITAATATTCIKPSGTVSQLVATGGSGIHPAHAKYFVRRVRCDSKDPLALWMIDQGMPFEKDVASNNNIVFAFPRKAPAKAITRHNVSAIRQLELWKTYSENWCEHNVSITVYVGEDEWMDVGAWVFAHFNSIIGVSFLPREDSAHSYRQAPYEDITAEKYSEMSKEIPRLKFEDYREFDDMTTATHELACTAGSCEI